MSVVPRPDADVRCVLFDLGNVLVRFRGVERVAELLGEGPATEALWASWLRSRTVRDFELGRLTPQEFCERFLTEFPLEVTPEGLRRELDGWVSGPMEGALELLDELAPRYLVACLSNTNALHWPELFARMGLVERFARAFVSCETGLLKPDPAVYEHVSTCLELAPGRILFFDDARLNVDAARAAGFQAIRADSPGACRAELCRRGLLAGAGG